jgi:hypothetical protein
MSSWELYGVVDEDHFPSSGSRYDIYINTGARALPAHPPPPSTANRTTWACCCIRAGFFRMVVPVGGPPRELSYLRPSTSVRYSIFRDVHACMHAWGCRSFFRGVACFFLQMGGGVGVGRGNGRRHRPRNQVAGTMGPEARGRRVLQLDHQRDAHRHAAARRVGGGRPAACVSAAIYIHT